MGLLCTVRWLEEGARVPVRCAGFEGQLGLV